jgi:hypothetical protein
VLEAFADAVKAGVRFPFSPEEIVNNVAVMEAVAASARSGEAVTIACARAPDAAQHGASA